MTRFVLAAAATGLALMPAAAAAAPSPRTLARACADGSIVAAFTPADRAEVRTIARCVVRRLRAGRDLRTRTDRRLQAAADGALRVAVGHRDDAIGRAKVTEALVRHACRHGQVANVAWGGTDTAAGGAARTPLALATFLRDEQHLVRRGTRVAVAVRTGRLLRAERSGAVAVLVTSARCRS